MELMEYGLQISAIALMRGGKKFSIYLRKLVPISHRSLHLPRSIITLKNGIRQNC